MDSAAKGCPRCGSTAADLNPQQGWLCGQCLLADETTFQWLIERGQPEGEQNAVWLEHSVMHPATEKQWTSSAWDAAMFPSQETAEAYIAEQGLEARAVEHGFMHEPTENERLRTTLARIRNNAESWHGDDAAKGRALAVIAEWAQEALDV